MVYRVELDISFADESDAVALMNAVEQIKSKVYVPSGTEKMLVKRECRYHPCQHTDAIPTPCGNYVNVDFNAAVTEHLVKG